MALSACKAAVALTAVFLVSACAGQPKEMTLAAAPDDLFDHSAPIEVTGSQSVTSRNGHVVSGAADGAARGYASGVMNSAFGSVISGIQAGPAGLAVGLVMAPIMAISDGIAGAANAHEAFETDDAVATLNRVYADHKLLAGIDRQVADKVALLGFPSEPACDRDPPATAGCRPRKANRLRLTTAYGFATTDPYNPGLQVGIHVTAVASSADGSRAPVTYAWTYVTPMTNFFSATRDEAAPLRAAIAKAQERLAQRIVDDLVLVRHKVRMAGTVQDAAGGKIFRTAALVPGIASRWPTARDLGVGKADGAPTYRLLAQASTGDAGANLPRSN